MKTYIYIGLFALSACTEITKNDQSQEDKKIEFGEKLNDARSKSGLNTVSNNWVYKCDIEAEDCEWRNTNPIRENLPRFDSKIISVRENGIYERDYYSYLVDSNNSYNLVISNLIRNGKEVVMTSPSAHINQILWEGENCIQNGLDLNSNQKDSVIRTWMDIGGDLWLITNSITGDTLLESNN